MPFSFMPSAPSANVYKKAARIMAEKAFVEIDKEDKKRSSPYAGDVKDDN